MITFTVRSVNGCVVCRLTATMLYTFLYVVDVTVLFVTFVLFFGMLGMQWFNSDIVPGYLDDDDNFNTLGSSTLATYILTTTENFPTVMYPALAARPFLAIVFFVSAIFVYASHFPAVYSRAWSSVRS
jgi:hypothetical protein